MASGSDLAANSVHFPPRDLSDIVLHYDSCTFHVHKYVLHQHSKYFREIIRTLQAQGPASAPASSSIPADTNVSSAQSASSAASASPVCNHPHTAHCIHLPRQTTLVANAVITAADFRLFLCHLYCAPMFQYPPFLPETEVDLDSDDLVAASMHFPVPSLTWDNLSNMPIRGITIVEPLLMLAHYFDCAQMLQQIEAIMLTQVIESPPPSTPPQSQTPQLAVAHNFGPFSQAGVAAPFRFGSTAVQLPPGVRPDRAWVTTECVRGLQYADRYNLRKWRAACIKSVAEDENLADNQMFKDSKSQWSSSLLVEVLEAALQTMRKQYKALQASSPIPARQFGFQAATF